MKTTILISVFAVLVSTMNLNAKGIATYSNVETNESGVKKEYIKVNEETSTPIEKVNYVLDNNGNVLSRTFSVWKSNKGWVNCIIYNYQYNETNKIANVTYTKWDEKKGIWSDKTDISVYVYDNNNQFLYVRHETRGTDMNNSNDFITLK